MRTRILNGIKKINEEWCVMGLYYVMKNKMPKVYSKERYLWAVYDEQYWHVISLHNDIDCARKKVKFIGGWGLFIGVLVIPNRWPDAAATDSWLERAKKHFTKVRE